jgi:hypothetical protein
MSFVKFDFLNWRPDMEDYNNDGLLTASNLLHDVEGYKQVLRQTTTSFSTTAPLNAGQNTVSSLKARPFGNAGALAIADIYAPTATTAAFRIGVQGENAFTTTTLATLASVYAADITTFSVAELGQRVVINAQAQASLLAGGITTYALGGQFTYTVTSV